MRRLFLAAILLGLAPCAHAQQAEVTLKLSVEQAMLVVQTLGQIACPNVTALMTCTRAAELLREIQRQVAEQAK